MDEDEAEESDEEPEEEDDAPEEVDSEPVDVEKRIRKKAFGYGMSEDDESDKDDDKPKKPKRHLPNPNRYINSSYYKPCGCA